jgi:type I restriction enzyme S subunit
MERYEKYKDSGVEWIGEIPAGWEVKKIKHRCYVKGRVGWKGLKSSEFLINGFSYLVTGTDFKGGKVYWKGCYHIDKERYEEDPFIQLQDNDLLITKDGTIGKLAIVDNLDKPACLNSGIFVVRSLNDDFTTRYLYWMLSSDIFTKFNEYTSYGSTIQHLYQNVFVEFAFSFPTREDQTAIANYLDRKTAEIDELIAQKERLLELYEEEKTAIINQAVTKGLDPEVKLKDSGIDWLGEIPEGWEVKKIKYLLKKKRGALKTGPFGSQIKNSDLNPLGKFKVYTQRNVMDSNYITGEDRIDDEKFRSLKEFEIMPHDILFTTRGTIGKCSIFLENMERGILHPCLIRIQIDESLVLPSWIINYVSNSSFFLENVKLESNSTIIDVIYGGTLKEIVISLPPAKEQTTIVQHIETETARINAKIARTKKIIKLQKEYRTALISEVVTGKIKVTQEAAS